MIEGIVNEYHEAVLRIRVRGTGSIVHELEAVLDTGFDGYLSLSTDLVEALGLPFLEYERVMLSNGAIEECALHEGTIFWDGEERPIRIQASEGGALIGMALMQGYDLNIHIEPGGAVGLTPF